MIGAGNRGYGAYGRYAVDHPDEVRFVAVAEPDPARRARFAETHGIPPEHQFAAWEDLLARPTLAPAAINTTQDRMHHRSTLALLQAGYDVLLEKPMAPSAAECVELVHAAEQQRRMLQICHVLRYAAFFRAVYDIVNDGRLGEIVNLEWNENLVFWHYVHSFVRGNWGNSQRSGPMILTKCCHDLDLLVWILGGPPQRLASFGSLTHFRSDRVGPEIPARCTDGCPIADACDYYAPRLYIEQDHGRWLRDPVSLDHSPAALRQALETGPYGRCVYRCDNDVVDHQVVLLQFANGLAATLTMQGSSHVEGRTLRIDGTRATLLGNEARNELQIREHRSQQVETIHPQRDERGHGGGDVGLMRAFVGALGGDRRQALTSAAEALDSHLLAFAAEEARVHQQVIETADYWSRVGAPQR
jgi:predicted dehydrogenase